MSTEVRDVHRGVTDEETKLTPKEGEAALHLSFCVGPVIELYAGLNDKPSEKAAEDVASLCELEEPTLHELEDKASVGSWEKIRSSVLHAATEAEGLPMVLSIQQCSTASLHHMWSMCVFL